MERFIERFITDDDRFCARCKELDYRPGESSTCAQDFPYQTDDYGEVYLCDFYDEIDYPQQNWAVDITRY